MITDKWPILNSILNYKSKTQRYFKMPQLIFGIASLMRNMKKKKIDIHFEKIAFNSVI